MYHLICFFEKGKEIVEYRFLFRGNFQKKKAQKGREGPSVNSQAASPAPAPPGPWLTPLTLTMALSTAAPPPTEQETGRGPAPETWAKVDNQGKSKTCTPHALSKGITEGKGSLKAAK